jgi:uncharacterized Tic20 family protein
MAEEKKPVEQEKPVDKDENMWAMFCHLSGLVGFVIPFGNVIAPLIIWTLKKDEYPHVDDQGKEALNFQISITVYILLSVLLIFVVIGIPLLIIIGLFWLIMTVIGAINANDGNKYRYPFTIKFIK